jgi:transposase
VPALTPYLIEPIWEQFSALLPEREVDHPLGCHKPRIPDWVVFEKLVQVLVFGCAYHRIADEVCSATTLRRRRDEWIEGGVMERLREMSLAAYDRTVGLELADVAVDGCITKAPCGGEKAGRNPVDRGKQGTKRSTAVDAKGIPIGTATALANRHDSPLLTETLDAVTEVLGELPKQAKVHLDGGYDSKATRERLEEAARRAWATRRDLPEGRQAGPASGHEALGYRAYQLVAQRPQEARVVYGARGAGHRLLGGILGRYHHREEAHPRNLEPLPLGGSTSSPALTSWRKL